MARFGDASLTARRATKKNLLPQRQTNRFFLSAVQRALRSDKTRSTSEEKNAAEYNNKKWWSSGYRSIACTFDTHPIPIRRNVYAVLSAAGVLMCAVAMCVPMIILTISLIILFIFIIGISIISCNHHADTHTRANRHSTAKCPSAIGHQSSMGRRECRERVCINMSARLGCISQTRDTSCLLSDQRYIFFLSESRRIFDMRLFSIKSCEYW